MNLNADIHTNIHADIIKSYYKYKKNFQTVYKWVTADEFTKKILDYANNKDLMVNENFHRLVFKLVELNEKPGNRKTPYTAEKPNFAILISIVKNFVQYSKEYGIDFLKELLLHFEEAAFTGVFCKDGGIDLQKYYKVVYRFLKIYLGNRLENSELSSISNTLVYLFLEETGKDHVTKNKRKTIDSNSIDSNSIDSKINDIQTKKNKQKIADGIRKKKTKHKNKYKQLENITKRKYKLKYRVTKQNKQTKQTKQNKQK